ncbi:MAG: YceI family protein [Planctomycetaceae bacterium]
MSFKTLTAAVFMLGFMNLSYAAEKLELNTEASKIEFVGKKADGSHTGGFKKFTADAIADFEEPSKGSLTINIDTTSLWSDDEKLTSHLKNPDFFDVRKYPTITFKSTALIVGEEEGKAKIKGDLTMLGKTAEIEVPCEVQAGDDQVSVDAKFVLDRTRWGMNYGSGKVNNEVDVKARLVFNR